MTFASNRTEITLLTAVVVASIFKAFLPFSSTTETAVFSAFFPKSTVSPSTSVLPVWQFWKSYAPYSVIGIIFTSTVREEV